MSPAGNQKAILNSLPLLATVLGKKYGVKVIIEGDQACTDGKTIYLPALPNQADDVLLGLLRGYCDHESAHIRATDFDVLKAPKLSPLAKHITNIFEDWRVENELAKYYPGSRKNFDWMIRYQFSKPPELDLPLKAKLMNYLLLTVRSWDLSIIEVQRDYLAKNLEASQPKLMKEIHVVLKRLYKNCQSTADCLAYAKEIEKLIKNEAGRASSKLKSLDKTGSPSQLQCDERSEIGSVSEMSSLDSTAKDLPQDASEQIAQQIAKMSQKAKANSRVEIAQEKLKDKTALAPSELKECLRSSVALNTRLSGLLQAKKLCRSSLGRRGRIDHTSLYKIGRDPKLFRRQGFKQKLNTSVHILLDTSSSMRPHMTLASQACYAVAKALDSLAGVNLQVTAFPGERNSKGATVSPLLRHEEALHKNFQIRASGSTPVAQSLWWVFQQDVFRNESRKLILLITDGEADCVNEAKEAIAFGQELGFEFHGIGLKNSAIEVLLPQSSEVIHSLNDLAPQIFKLLENSLVHH